LLRGHNYCQNLIASTKVFPVFRLFIDDKIIAQGQNINFVIEK
jgi:hypothetical protein